WIDHHDERIPADAADRRDIADKIEGEIGVKRRVDHVRRSDQEQRVAVGRRTHDCRRGDIAAGAGPILDDEWLAKSLRQRLTEQARDDVRRAPGIKADDEAHRPRRIVERRCDVRQCGRGGDARQQKMQKFPAGKFHAELSTSMAAAMRRDQSALAPENLMTLAHFSVSATMNRPNSAGVIGMGSPPRSLSRALICGSARPALIVPLSLSMMSAGVFRGAPMPSQALAS